MALGFGATKPARDAVSYTAVTAPSGYVSVKVDLALGRAVRADVAAKK
jgi:hypothetical protein